jgi:hypothetical protein
MTSSLVCNPTNNEALTQATQNSYWEMYCKPSSKVQANSVSIDTDHKLDDRGIRVQQEQNVFQCPQCSYRFWASLSLLLNG